MTPVHAARVLLSAALLALSGCVPATSSYLSIPIETVDGKPRGHAEIRVPIAELRQRMSGFELEELAFYHRGREPIPHRLVDEDDDGLPDAAAVVVPVLDGGSSRLIALCPGPAASEAMPEPSDDGAGVVLRFDRARR